MVSDSIYTRQPLSVVAASGYLWVFGLAPNNTLVRRVYNLSAGQWIADWEILDTHTAGQPSAVVYTDGNNQSLSVYLRGDDDHLWELYWTDATNPNNPSGWYDVSANVLYGYAIKGYVTATSSGDKLSVFTNWRDFDGEPVIIWSHATGYISPGDAGTGEGVPIFRPGVASNGVAVFRQGFGGYLQLFDHEFFPEDTDDYWHPYFGQYGVVADSVPAMLLSKPSSGPASVLMFADVGGQIQTNTVYGDHSQTGWTSYGTCSTSGAPAMGRQNTVSGGTPFPYYPRFGFVTASLVAADTTSTCRNLGGALASAPVAVTVLRLRPTALVDYVFYKGLNGHAWMYTSASGHQDLGLTLAPLEGPVTGGV